jgi:hypothetical protein
MMEVVFGIRSHPVLAALSVATMLIASACGGGTSSDLEAYCELVRSGAGLGAADAASQAEDLAELSELAPEEVKEAVQQLRNTTGNLDDIEELGQLFDAAFDPDAQEAKDTFNAFAVTACGLDESALPEGGAVSENALLNDLGDYIDKNFADTAWAPKIRHDVERIDGVLAGIEITFVVDAQDNEAMQACSAVAVYLYDISQASGEVTVKSNDLVAARSAGTEDRCEEVS